MFPLDQKYVVSSFDAGIAFRDSFENSLIAYGTDYQGMQMMGQGRVPYGMGRSKYLYGIKGAATTNIEARTIGIDRDY